ncbi:DUF4271 domain-containing protein [Maribacter sp. CXY002]|uniref:DUF4271 domain-containing protein n=1 Tax=Maribacter luteocoastalis TaxID=3407671 RepID=UPI003B67D698
MEPILRYSDKVDWITILIFGSLLFIIGAKILHYSKFINFIILPFNNKYIFMYSKKEKLFNRFHILLTTFQIINTSLFIFLAWNTFKHSTYEVLLYLLILSGFFLFIVIKTVVQLGNGFIFGNYRIFNEIVFKKTSYLNYSGIVLFIANLILAYVFPSSQFIVFLAISLFVLINLIGWVTVVKNHQILISNYFFYFILYLCALEIAPLIIMGSFLK